jgi:hypothetical protein
VVRVARRDRGVGDPVSDVHDPDLAVWPPGDASGATHEPAGSREFRVAWKREGLRRATAIFQTLAGANAKAARLRGEFTVECDGGYGTVYTMEGTEWLDDRGVPPLEFLRVESRPVGKWALLGDDDAEAGR